MDKHSSEASLSTIQVIVVRINRLWAAAQTIHEDSKAGRNSGQDLRRQQCLENVKLDCIIPEMSSRSGLLLPTNHNNTAKTSEDLFVDFLESLDVFSRGSFNERSHSRSRRKDILLQNCADNDLRPWND